MQVDPTAQQSALVPDAAEQADLSSSADALLYFITQTHWQAIPADVRHEAKRSLLNYFALAFAGSADPDVTKLVSFASRFSAATQAGLIGRHERTDILHAAALNALSANVHDFDDTHLPTIIHPTAPVAAALFALAESRSISGETLLLAFILGVEVECRIGNAMPGHYQKGAHITSTCGVFGAASAIAVALGLSAEQLRWAWGHASAQACGLVETLGTTSKSLSVGNAARNGLISALLAADDLSGPQQPLDGRYGFLRVNAADPVFTELDRELGAVWALSSNTYKPYPCGVVLNPVIEACIALSPSVETLADIVRVELTGHPLLRERTDRPHVRSGRESQVSAQHAVAVVLTTGKAGLAQFNDASVANPDYQALADRVTFVDAAEYRVEAAKVSITMQSGKIVTKAIAAARGSLFRPLTDADLESKLRTLLSNEWGSRCSTSAIQALIDSIWSLDMASDASLPMRLTQTILE